MKKTGGRKSRWTVPLSFQIYVYHRTNFLQDAMWKVLFLSTKVLEMVKFFRTGKINKFFVIGFGVSIFDPGLIFKIIPPYSAPPIRPYERILPPRHPPLCCLRTACAREYVHVLYVWLCVPPKAGHSSILKGRPNLSKMQTPVWI